MSSPKLFRDLESQIDSLAKVGSISAESALRVKKLLKLLQKDLINNNRVKVSKRIAEIIRSLK